MCGRIIQANPPDLLALKIVNGLDDRDNRIPAGTNSPPRYNGAPSIGSFGGILRPASAHSKLLQWGLLPNWCKDPKALRPINAMAETVVMRGRRCAMVFFDIQDSSEICVLGLERAAWTAQRSLHNHHRGPS